MEKNKSRPLTCLSNITNIQTDPCTPIKSELKEEIFPWTPTSNFKLLLKAVSPDIRKREEMSIKTSECLAAQDCNDDLDIITTDDCSILKNYQYLDCFDQESTKRLDKSLGLLCKRFLELFKYESTSLTEKIVCLKTACHRLNIERRRLYDILNVLEVIGVASRKSKNIYALQDRINMISYLKNLKKLALEDKFEDLIDHYLHLQRLQDFTSSILEIKESISNTEKHKMTLAYMTKLFVQIYITKQNEKISLEFASKIILKSNQIGGKCHKTALRRLYDVANILSALNIIEKVKFKGEKAAFIYSGPCLNENAPPNSVERHLIQNKKSSKTLKKYLSFDQSNIIKTQEFNFENNTCSSPELKENFKENIDQQKIESNVNNLTKYKIFTINRNIDSNKENLYIDKRMNKTKYPIIRCSTTEEISSSMTTNNPISNKINFPSNPIQNLTKEQNIFKFTASNNKIVHFISPRTNIFKPLNTQNNMHFLKRHLTCNDLNQTLTTNHDNVTVDNLQVNEDSTAFNKQQLTHNINPVISNLSLIGDGKYVAINDKCNLQLTAKESIIPLNYSVSKMPKIIIRTINKIT